MDVLWRVRLGFFTALLAAATALGPLAWTARAADFEAPPAFNAADVLGPGRVRGTHYTIDPRAQNDGFMNRYKVTSPFGTMEAYGDAMVMERAREMDAIAAIRKIKKTDAYMKGLENAIVSPFEASKEAITKPIQTLGNLADRTKQLVSDVFSAIKNLGKDSGREEDSSLLKDLIGYNKTKRKLAFELGVDPYSSNRFLQQELGDLAWAGFAGNATIDLAISAATAGGVGVAISAVEMATASESLLREQSPTSLTNINTQHLAAMGIEGEEADAFLFHAQFSVRHQTLLVHGLAAMENVAGRADYVRLANSAKNENEALFFQRTARNHGRLPSAGAEGGAHGRQRRRGVLRGCRRQDDPAGACRLRGVDAEVGPDDRGLSRRRAVPGARSPALWITGTVSPRTRNHLAAQGIAIEERVFPRRLADRVIAVKPSEAPEARK
ncbi:MAG: hypothetical protein IIC55_10875 [Proteobacteria bacterium]|nr:hypothetical protein [Pseudomonadota bacterium]